VHREKISDAAFFAMSFLIKPNYEKGIYIKKEALNNWK